MLSVGTVLRNRYRIIKVLGSGGFGDTYLAEDVDLPGHPKCVVKQLRPKDTSPEVFQIAKGLFEREAEYLYRIGNAHPDIPDLYAHFTEGGEFYLVQEYIEGENLANELPPGKKLSEPETIKLLVDILEVLSFVHAHHVIHRDIKLSNLIRRKSNGKIVIIDFGAVKDVSVIQTSGGGVTNMTVSIGSPGYMPSEQAQGKPKLSSDVYAVGMIGIQALTGLLPTQIPEDVHTGELLWDNLVQISPALRACLHKMTHYHFGQRYPSAIEALSALREIVAESHNQPTQLLDSTPPAPTIPRLQDRLSPPVQPTVVLPQAVSSPRQGHQLLLTGVLILLGSALGIGGWWWFLRPRPDTTTAVSTPTLNTPAVETPDSFTLPDINLPTPPMVNVDLYGAMARSSKTGDKGYAWDFPSQSVAEQKALEQCANLRGADDCQIMVWFQNACASMAEADNGGAGAGWGKNGELAEIEALRACSTVGENCKVVKTICTENVP